MTLKDNNTNYGAAAGIVCQLAMALSEFLLWPGRYVGRAKGCGGESSVLLTMEYLIYGELSRIDSL